MPRPPIKQQRARATRARIIAGSAAVFAEHGYAGASVADILDRAAVTKGALYFHFETKEEVAEAVLAAHTAWLADIALAVRGQGLQGAVDLTYLLAASLATDDVLRAAVRLSVERETFAPAQEPAYRQWQQLCIQLLTEAQDGLELRREVDVVAVARVMMSTLLGASLASWGLGGGRSPVRADLQTFWRIALPGILTSDRVGRVDPMSPEPGRWSASAAVRERDGSPSV